MLLKLGGLRVTRDLFWTPSHYALPVPSVSLLATELLLKSFITFRSSLGKSQGLKIMILCPHLYDIFFGFNQQLVLEFFGHLHIKELLQSSLDGHGALAVPLLHLVAELISVVELFDLFKICLVIAIAKKRQYCGIRDGEKVMPHIHSVSEPDDVKPGKWLDSETVVHIPEGPLPLRGYSPSPPPKKPPDQGFAYPSTPFISMLMSMVSSPSSSARQILRNWSSLSSLTGLFFKYLKE